MDPHRYRRSFRLSSAPTSRAQLSPVSRGSAFASLASHPLSPATSESWPLARALELERENRAARWWDPQLLDRLAAPLTRYHD